jgi:hypothetical protein
MNRLRGPYRPRMWWAELMNGRHVPLYRDSKLCLIVPFTDYAIHIAQKALLEAKIGVAYDSAIEETAYGMQSFSLYCWLNHLDWTTTCDADVYSYREWLFRRIRAGGRSKTKRSAKRTVNIRLRVLYRFFEWSQETAFFTKNIIGWKGCRIRSTLILVSECADSRDMKTRLMYPLCYRSVGEKSRTSDGRYWATADDINDIEAYFWQNPSHLIAQRNVMMLRIAEYMGWRRGSISGLTTDQFSRVLIENAEKRKRYEFSVTPSVQKFNRGFSFDVPFELAYAIRNYIEGPRAEILAAAKVDEGVAEYRLFLSLTTGTPLNDRTLSAIFTKAFKAIGAPEGAGLRSIRRKFAEEINAAELQFRQRNGLSLAPEDIAFATAPKLGHGSILSQEAYNRVLKGKKQQSVEEVMRRELLAKDAENLDLRHKNAALETQVQTWGQFRVRQSKSDLTKARRMNMRASAS